MLAYLCVLNNPLDDLRLRTDHQQPAPGHRRHYIGQGGRLGGEPGGSLYEIIRNADLFPEPESVLPAKA